MHLKYYHLQSKLNLYVSAHTVHCYRWQIHNYFNIQIVIYMCKAASKDWTQYNNISERDEFVIYCSIVEFSFNVLFERGLSVFSCTILGFFFRRISSNAKHSLKCSYFAGWKAFLLLCLALSDSTVASAGSINDSEPPITESTSNEFIHLIQIFPYCSTRTNAA